ncbi:hypothetical protein EEO02_24510, partial [Salmonella enterica]|nr:hypothetical protein [Salmonella enterica]
LIQIYELQAQSQELYQNYAIFDFLYTNHLSALMIQDYLSEIAGYNMFSNIARCSGHINRGGYQMHLQYFFDFHLLKNLMRPAMLLF